MEQTRETADQPSKQAGENGRKGETEEWKVTIDKAREYELDTTSAPHGVAENRSTPTPVCPP